jgi:hypothetical protein
MQPLFLCLLGRVFPGVIQPEGVADHSQSAKVEDMWSCAFTPPYIFMASCLITHRINISFLLLLFVIFTYLSPKFDISVTCVENY